VLKKQQKNIVMNKKYNNPPIKEAICEFNFSPETIWDITIPGIFFEKVNNKYPIKNQRKIQEIGMHQDGHGELYQKITTSDRILFYSDDNYYLIQMGPRFLAIHRMNPYNGWLKFKPQIEFAIKTLHEIIKKCECQSIGLKYINSIELPADIELERYFDFYPYRGQNIMGKMENFIAGNVLSFNEGRDIAKVVLTNEIPNIPDKISILLDLNYYLDKPQTFSIESILQWIEEAHEKIEAIFEACIKDSLRERFQMVTK
jgi:uncharacterized protein (TIGR04255 family)